MTEPTTRKDDSIVPPQLPRDPTQTFDPMKSATIDSEWVADIRESTGETARTIVEGRLRIPEVEADENPLGATTYRRQEVAGRGGFGEVWKGTQPSLSRNIALKRLRADLLTDPTSTTSALAYYVTSFRQEAFTTASLEHPNIVPVYDFGQDDEGRPVMAMKFVRGTPWDKLIWEDADLDETEFLPKHLEILIDVAQAVAFAHSRGIVHRDIKPSQVMVTDYGETLLKDWGLALVFDKESAVREIPALFDGPSVPTISTGANPAGTVAFMAPEQTEDTCRRIGPATDVYLLGGTLYYLLTRTPPHSSLDPEEAFAQARLGEMQDPRERAKERLVPAELAELAMHALHFDPKKRPRTVREFIGGLRDYLTGAGKRLESIRLIDQAVQVSAQEDRDYTGMAAALNLVERAAGLWSTNPEAAPLRQRILSDYARLALEHGDLELARIHAESLDESSAKRELLNDVEAAEARARFQTVLIRLAFVFIIAILMVVSLLAARLNRTADLALEAEDAAAAEAQNAARAKADAEELVGFLARDLYQQLAPLNRLDLLDRLAGRAQAYYDELDSGHAQLSRTDVRNRTRLLGNIGEIRFGQGRLEAARTAFGEAVGMARGLVEDEPDNVENESILAEGLLNLGHTLLISNQVGEGERMLHEALEIFERVSQAEEEDLSRVFPVARINSLFSGIEYARGNSALALEFEQNALRALQPALRRAPDEQVLSQVAGSHARIAEILLYRGRSHLAAGSVDQGLTVVERAINASGENYRARATMARLLDLRARSAESIGDFAAAAAANQSAGDIWRNLTSRDASNAEFQSALANSTALRADISFLTGDRANADFHMKTALRLTQDLVRNEPANITYQAQLTRAFALDGFRLRQSGNPSEAISQLDRALRIVNYQSHADPTLKTWEHARAEILVLSGNAQRDLGDAMRAQEAFDEALAIYTGAIASDPENLSFALGRARCRLRLAAMADDEAAAAEQLRLAGEDLGSLDYDGQRLPVEAVSARALHAILTGDPQAAWPLIERAKRDGFVDKDLRDAAAKANIEI